MKGGHQPKELPQEAKRQAAADLVSCLEAGALRRLVQTSRYPGDGNEYPRISCRK
jgi:hypothetical protein